MMKELWYAAILVCIWTNDATVEESRSSIVIRAKRQNCGPAGYCGSGCCLVITVPLTLAMDNPCCQQQCDCSSQQPACSCCCQQQIPCICPPDQQDCCSQRQPQPCDCSAQSYQSSQAIAGCEPHITDPSCLPVDGQQQQTVQNCDCNGGGYSDASCTSICSSPNQQVQPCEPSCQTMYGCDDACQQQIQILKLKIKVPSLSQCSPMCQPTCQPSCVAQTPSSPSAIIPSGKMKSSLNDDTSMSNMPATTTCDAENCVCQSGYVQCAQQMCCLRYQYMKRLVKP